MNWRADRITGIALAAWLLPALALAGQPAAHVAEFEVLRNGKVMGESRFSLDVSELSWEMRSETRGTRGLAKLAGFEEASISRGDWRKGRPRPLSSEQNVKAAFKKIHTVARYDWPAKRVHTRHEEGESDLEITRGTVDPSMLNLWLADALSRGESEWTLQQVDEDKIEAVTFRLVEHRELDTAVGCLEVAVVEKVRDPASTRYTRTFHAVAHDHAVVFVEHGKRDGDRLETRLTSLQVDEQPVTPGPACPR